MLTNILFIQAMALETGIFTIKGVDVSSEVNDKVNASGNRNVLAGYESAATVTSLSVTASTQDSLIYNSTSAITCNNGTAGQAWIKVVTCKQVPASVSIGNQWAWVGGSAPTLKANGTLIFCWNGNNGLVNFLSA